MVDVRGSLDELKAMRERADAELLKALKGLDQDKVAHISTIYNDALRVELEIGKRLGVAEKQ